MAAKAATECFNQIVYRYDLITSNSQPLFSHDPDVIDCTRQDTCVTGDVTIFLCAAIYQSLAVFCGVLRCFAVFCGVLRRFAAFCGVLQQIAAFCGVLRLIAANCGVLRRFAAFCGGNIIMG